MTFRQNQEAGKSPYTDGSKKQACPVCLPGKTQGWEPLEHSEIKRALWHKPYCGEHDTQWIWVKAALGKEVSVQHVEFLKVLDRKAPKKKVLHIIADNYSAHKAPEVKEYLKQKEGRFIEHHIPTYSSWLNMIERWFAEITNKRIRRESWSSLRELEEAITDYIISWNESGRRFSWTKTFDDIKTSIMLSCSQVIIFLIAHKPKVQHVLGDLGALV